MEKRICKVDGCQRKHIAKGYCNIHYQRVRNHGDPLFYTNPIKHGMYYTSEYRTWSSMLTRCYNTKDKTYERYGAKGITVCDEWRDSFEASYRDMGDKPFPKAQIDREENDKGYYKSNCRWVTATINIRNRDCIKLSMEKAREIRRFHGEYKQVELAEEYGVSTATLWKVIHNKIWKEL